jgi:CHAT domain-containing protein
VLDSIVAAMVTTAHSTAIRVLALSPDTLRAWITRFRAPIAPRVGSSIDRANIGFDDVVAERLYGALVDPLVADLGGRTELTIVPDGPLHTLPFDALVSSRAPRRYMIDDYTIAYAAPRAGATRARGTMRIAGGEGIVLAIGGPEQRAAGAAHEIRAMASVLGGRLSALPHASIAGARARAEGSDVRVIHFATHAEANDASPDHARLALSVDSTGAAGWLHAFEIREWKLDGALVVLSACETAEGRLAGGEGTLSLSRAFMRGGASGTVATLWPVGAPTATLMASFYRGLAAGGTTAAALRAARLELRRAGFDHPFYWAPFVFTTSDLSHSG